jgi:predicted RNA binding protein YcfA (HicA-like mRNA interferase family)
MNSRRLLLRLARGDLRNIGFDDTCRLLGDLGFELARVRGSHHIFVHRDVREMLNMQDVGGQVKPCQLRQLLRLIEAYDLELEDKR